MLLNFTQEEVKLLKEDIYTTWQYFHQQLTDNPEPGCEWTVEEREEVVNMANAAWSTYCKLEGR